MRKNKHQSGMMMIELVCALFIVTVGLFGVLQMYTLAFEKSSYVAEYTIALRALENEIETLRALPFEALDTGHDLPFRSETPEIDRLVNAQGMVAIENPVEGPDALKEITVSVRWTGEHGRRIEKSLTTLMARKD